MPCYHPVKAWRGSENENGKRPLVFSRQKGLAGTAASAVEIPCGQCIGCRLERARQWAVRLVHEKQFHDESAFITLTYDEDHLPENGSLNKRDISLFMKRLRKAHDDKKIRFFQCGEYGENFARPHHHAIIFGHSFPDAKAPIISSESVKRSAELADLWPFGFNSVGDVTFDSACYVAGYIVKKITGKRALDHYKGRLPEYVTMSRRPGIANDFYKLYSSDIYPADTVVINGKECKPPRYYDKLLELDKKVDYDKIRAVRMKDRDPFDENVSFDRLDKREKVVERNQFIFKGGRDLNG